MIEFILQIITGVAISINIIAIICLFIKDRKDSREIRKAFSNLAKGQAQRFDMVMENESIPRNKPI